MAEPRHLLGTAHLSVVPWMVPWGANMTAYPRGGFHNPILDKAAQFTLFLPKLKFGFGKNIKGPLLRFVTNYVNF